MNNKSQYSHIRKTTCRSYLASHSNTFVPKLMKSLLLLSFCGFNALSHAAAAPAAEQADSATAKPLANNQSPPCFPYIIEGSHGCPNPQGCDFCHLDLQCDKTVNLRPEFFRELLQLLDQPAVRQHFAPTQAFTHFCRSNHIQL